MKNIVILSELKGGGVEKVNKILAENLDKKKYKIKVIGITGRGKNEVEINGFDYESLDIKNQSKSIFKLISLLKKISPDIIISCGSYDTYYSLLYSKFINKKCSSIYVHHSVYTSNLSKKRGIKKVLHHYIPKMLNLYNLCERVVYVSKGVKEDLELHYYINEKKSSIIYNPIVDERINVHKKNEWDNKILTIGRIEEEKDQVSIIKAIKYLKELGYEYTLTIAGEGSLRQYLKDKCIRLGIENQVYFIGYKNDIYKELQEHDLFVLSSKHESFGNVIVEAMYSETPVISTDCMYGPKEIIGENEYGFLVPVEDYKKLAEKIREVTNMNNEPLIKKSKNYSMKFTVKEAINSYEKVIDSL